MESFFIKKMAILALITSGNNYVGLGSRRGGGHPPPAGLDWQGGGGEVYSGTHFISSTLVNNTADLKLQS